MPGGRPTKYNPSYCQKLIDFLSQGYSLEAFCGHVSLSKETLYRWFEEYPEFSNAKKEAMTKCRAFWEKIGIDSATGKNTKSNSTTWIFNMKNRFGWKDKAEIDNNHSGSLDLNVHEIHNAKNQAALKHEPK